jgi:hypothetical protein
MNILNNRRQIPDPIRGLTHQRLGQQIDAYTNGAVAEFAITAEAMENRDDMLKNVIMKRKKAVTRHGWEILAENDSPEAREQRDALDYFYRNLTCSHALRKDESGGFQLLAYQMMDAVGKGYAVHEIEWKPVVGVKSKSEVRGARRKAEGKKLGTAKEPSDRRACQISNFEPRISDLPRDLLTARFIFVPLWYFEATSGKLRLLTTPGALRGEELVPKEWLITTGDALMVACARPFLFKHYPMQAWLDFTDRFGLPGMRGVTSAARGTPDFAVMEETLQTFMKELSVVTNSSEAIDILDLKGNGQPPFADLIERMDRVMASLWRGADLSTISRDRGYGATLQEQEGRILEQDDARALSEHLNATLDRWVLEHLFGPVVPRLARIKILVTPQECTPHDLAIDQFLVAHGARLSLNETMERYGRVQARPEEEALGNANGEVRSSKWQMAK